MFKKTAVMFTLCLTLAACASDKPRIVQATSDMPEVRLKSGMATQIEMPNDGRVQSIIVGNPALLTADKDGTIVNLVPKEALGETNLIVRSVEDGGAAKVYQYRVIVQN